jgi:hypothetical protein
MMLLESPIEGTREKQLRCFFLLQIGSFYLPFRRLGMTLKRPTAQRIRLTPWRGETSSAAP